MTCKWLSSTSPGMRSETSRTGSLVDYRVSIERDVTTLLATVQLVMNDMQDFLQRSLEDTRAVGETKLQFKAMLDCFLAHSERVKRVVFTPV